MTGMLDSKVAVVTGGASGIGLATVERFVAEGAKVVVGDIQEQQGKELEARFDGAVAFVLTDVRDEDAIAATVETAVSSFGRLDIMFNNAGNQGDGSPMMDLSADGLDQTLVLLTRSVGLGHKYAARQFQAQGTGGSIISTTSVAGLQGGWAGASYTIAKHAVIGVIRQAVAELAPLGIRSNAIAPGTIMTPIMANAFGVPAERASAFLDYIAAELGPKLPIGRVGMPEEIADVALFLASDLSRYVTGTTLVVDGGASAITQGTFGPDIVGAAATFMAS